MPDRHERLSARSGERIQAYVCAPAQAVVALSALRCIGNDNLIADLDALDLRTYRLDDPDATVADDAGAAVGRTRIRGGAPEHLRAYRIAAVCGLRVYQNLSRSEPKQRHLLDPRGGTPAHIGAVLATSDLQGVPRSGGCDGESLAAQGHSSTDGGRVFQNTATGDWIVHMRSSVGFSLLSAPNYWGRSDHSGRPPSRCCMGRVLNAIYAAVI